MESQQKIYFESQTPGTMTCGLHAVNAMLQGPVFNIDSLNLIAQEIDKAEGALGGASSFYASQNVAKDGNFSS